MYIYFIESLSAKLLLKVDNRYKAKRIIHDGNVDET